MVHRHYAASSRYDKFDIWSVSPDGNTGPRSPRFFTRSGPIVGTMAELDLIPVKAQ